MKSSDESFADLKEFLTSTESGWIQAKLMKTYCEQIARSIKARNSANAKKGKADAKEIINERIANEYAKRGVSHLLSIIHDPTLEGKPSNERKKIKKEKRNGEIVPRETLDVQLPDDPVERGLAERLMMRVGATKFSSWFQPPPKKNCTGYVVHASGQKADMIENRFGGALNEIYGKGQWRIEG